jgi:toxin ParE1/3/4
MYEIVKSPLAEEDLKEIWHYSYDRWGEEKATAYLLQLDAGIQGLRNNPQIGKAHDHIRKGYRAIQINRHVVFYRLQAHSINIVRVLHERRLPSKHL